MTREGRLLVGGRPSFEPQVDAGPGLLTLDERAVIGDLEALV
ncbi:hypothetical protein ACIRJM_30690 [Streptomyces sp. NPDC102405]